jgi:hypothetical protein
MHHFSTLETKIVAISVLKMRQHVAFFSACCSGNAHKNTQKLYNHAGAITAVLATTTGTPSIEAVRKLSMADIAIAAGLADELRDRFREYVHLDPYCLPDPFGDKDDFTYFVVLDRENLNRVVAMFANKKENLPQLPWSSILGERLAKVSISKEDAFALKHELMPKETNNFYPYRRNGKISGYAMFAFQICGQR